LNIVPGSPAIDAGDPSRPDDPDNTIADMGALYFHQPPGGFEVLSGSLNGTIDAGNYFVTGDIAVYASETLTLQPGVIFSFTGPHKLSVAGTLNAVGTESDYIQFVGYEGSDGWAGIRFAGSTSDESILEYCEISGSDSSGISIDGCSPTISKCLINGNTGIRIPGIAKFVGGGIRLIGSSALITECTIRENNAGAGWAGNLSRGGAISCEAGTDATISHCIIAENYSTGGGIVSRGAGISCEGESNPTIIHCDIIGNEADGYGGAIACMENSFPIVTNSIVCDNIGDGAMYFENYTSTCPVTYNDFYNNGDDQFTGYSPAGLGYIYSTNANGDSVDYHENIFLDPRFVDQLNWDLNLMEDSPCIDAGDPLSPLDPDDTVADMGAFYYHQTVGVGDVPVSEIPAEYCLHGAYPNPFNPSTTISYQLAENSQVYLSVYDIAGREIADLVNEYKPAGNHEITFNANDLTSGVYFVRLEAGEFRQVQKVVLMK